MKGTVAERYILLHVGAHPKFWGNMPKEKNRKNPWRNIHRTT